MYIAPSSGEPLPNINLPFKWLLRRFEVVLRCLEWECYAVLFKRLIKINSNPQVLYYGFNIQQQSSSNNSYETLTPCTCTVRAPVFGRHQFYGTSEHYGKAHGSLLSGWMDYNYTACCWFPTSSNILILPSQFWQIRFESYWLHCSKCRILVLLRYLFEIFHAWQKCIRFCFRCSCSHKQHVM